MLNILGKVLVFIFCIVLNLESKKLILNKIKCISYCYEEISELEKLFDLKIYRNKRDRFINVENNIELNFAIYDSGIGIWNINNNNNKFVFLDQTYSKEFKIIKDIEVKNKMELIKLKENNLKYNHYDLNGKNLFIIKDKFNNLIIYQENHLKYLIVKYINIFFIFILIIYFIYIKLIKRIRKI